ncbi:MAG: hypothetical protein KKH22_12045 [Proteobacteria bacterium]|nr:hypothetical protein [Pseudomonadota bacterium]
MKLDRDWKKIIKKAWSFRLMVLAGLLSTGEFILPVFSETIPRWPFAILSFLVITGAMAARLVAQKDFNQ